MKFNYVLSTDAQAGDTVDDLKDQIEGSGHEFQISRSTFLQPPFINLFGEGTREATIQHIANLHQQGYRLVILVTEAPTLVTSNGLVWNYMTSDHWLGRARHFLNTCPHVDAAWCYAPGASKIIKRWMPRAADIEPSWGRRYLNKRLTNVSHFDFCFFGGLTQRRGEVVQEFVKRGRTIDIIPHGSTLQQRDDRISISRVVLDIRQYDWWPLVSSVRYATALLCGRPVVAEWRSKAATKRWRDVVCFAPEDGFFDAAIQVLFNWEHEFERQVTAYRNRPNLIEKAIKILPKWPEPVIEPIRTGGWVTTSMPSRMSMHPPGPQAKMGPVGPRPQFVETVNGTINLVSWRNVIFAIPQIMGSVQLEYLDLDFHPQIKRYPDIQTARDVLRFVV